MRADVRGTRVRDTRKPDSWYRQSGVIAVRWRGGGPQVLLVTSSGGRRWVIPKGIVEEGLSPGRSAAKEAWEEAGVFGDLSRHSLGRYSYEKWDGVCTVRVYLMLVHETARRWPEGHVRTRRWLRPARAAQRVREPELRAMILALPPRRKALRLLCGAEKEKGR